MFGIRMHEAKEQHKLAGQETYFGFSLSLISRYHRVYCNHDEVAATRASYEKSMPSATTNINR